VDRGRQGQTARYSHIAGFPSRPHLGWGGFGETEGADNSRHAF
jgi:hypothetical protein